MPKRKKRAKVAARGARDFRHRAFTVPEMIRELWRHMSLAALSREMEIPYSALRAYKDGKREPTPGHRHMIAEGFEITRKEKVREKATRRVKAIGAPVRVMRIDPRDPKKKRRIAGDTVDRYVAQSDDSAILRVLYRAAERARLLDIPGLAQFLVLADETDPEYPGEYFWSGWQVLADMDNDEIDEYLIEIQRRGTPIILRYQDRGKP